MSCLTLGDIDIWYVCRSMRLIPRRVRHFLRSDSMGVMKRKLDLSKPDGYPPRSEIKGNKKKLNGPNHSGLLFFQTLGVVRTIRIIAGKSSQTGSFEANRNSFLKTMPSFHYPFRSSFVIGLLVLFSFLWRKEVTEAVPAGFFDVDIIS